MLNAKDRLRRSSIHRAAMGILAVLAAWHCTIPALAQVAPSGQGAATSATTPTPKVVVLANQPTNPCSGYSVTTQSVTIWYQTYFNPYTQKIQIVPACATGPCPPAGASSTVGHNPTAGVSSATITGGTATIAGGTATIAGGSASIIGATANVSATSISVGGIPIAGNTASITGGTATVANSTVTITGGIPTINGDITTIAGGTVTISGDPAIINNSTVTISGGASASGTGTTTANAGTLTIANGTTNLTGSTTTFNGGSVIVTGKAATTGGTIVVASGITTITGGNAAITGTVTSMSISGGTATITAGTASSGTGAGGNASTTGQSQPPPPQDVTKDPNQPNAAATPDTLKLQWDGSSGSCPATCIDVEIHICYHGREGVYKASSVKLNNKDNSFSVSLKEFGDFVIKQVLLTGCYDLCGPIYLDCPAVVFVSPYCKCPSNPDNSSVSPVRTMNVLPITIEAKPFSGSLAPSR